jgi:tetratricopeptide (TPR) repeat protein/serine/threonine protein kinase
MAQTTRGADLNLLFGILAVQMDFVSRDQLVAGMHAWVLDKSKALGAILVEQKVLGAERHALLQALVQEHLKQHQNDPQQSLAAVSSVGSVKKDLEKIADVELQASMVHVSAARAKDDDPYATAAGTATSTGLRFRILRAHAKGGLGEVFVAHDEELHREVALKEIQDRHADNPDSRSRFLLEAEITGGLEHPGIVPVYGLGQYADGRPFYAMRFIRGDSLKEAIERFHKGEPGASATGERTLEFRKLLGRFIDVCQAMQYAHDRGVLHRDLKPGNIMLGKYGETLVVDWGLAKAVGKHGEPAGSGTGEEPTLHPAHASSNAETVAGTAIGTPAFMSPEQAAGRLDLLGPASDVYSLGATLYCLLTGKPPIEGDDVGAVLATAQRGEYLAPRHRKSTVPAALEAVCRKAMALRPGDRYCSPRVLADEIEHWLADEPVTAWREPLWVRLGRWRRRNRALVTGLAATFLVVLVAAGAFGWWYQGEQARQAAERGEREKEQALRGEYLNKEVDMALEEATKKRADLRERLMDPRQVHVLLSDIDQWRTRLEEVKAAWRRAKALAQGGVELLDQDLADRLAKLERGLDTDDKDWALAKELDDVRLEASTDVDRKFDNRRGAHKYPQVFAKAGLVVEQDKPADVGARIARSGARYAWVAALDHWAWMTSDRKLLDRLLEAARRADPHPWRDRLRDLAVWADVKELERLVKEMRPEEQSPQVMLILAGRRNRLGGDPIVVLRQAILQHARDFWLYIDLGNYAEDPVEKIGCFQAALAIRPQSGSAYVNLGNALRDKKDEVAATAAYRKAIQINFNYATAHFNLGNALSAQKDHEGAVAAYKKANELDPKNALYLGALGNELIDQEDLVGAIAACKQAIALDSKLALVHVTLGNALAAQKDLPRAIACFEQAIKIDPKYALAHNNLGNTLYRQNNLLGAIAALKQAVALDPKYASAWNNLGVALRDYKDLGAGIDALKKAVALDPTHANGWYNLGLALGDQKDVPAAIDAYKKALALDPKLAMAWGNLGSALADQKNLPDAIAAYKRALDIDPKFATAWFNLGVALPDEKDFPAAIEAYKQAVAIDPKHVGAWTNLGNVLRQRKDFPAATDALKKALAIDPKFAVAWDNLGAVLYDQKDLPEAIDVFKKALTIDPKNANAWHNLGVALRDQKDLPAAIDAFTKAVGINPRYVRAWNNLGGALAAKKDLPAAIDAFHKALDIEPKNAQGWNNLGSALHGQKNLPAAIDAFHKALDVDAKYAFAWNNLGNALRDQKDLPAAVNAFNKALEIEPKNARAWYNLGTTLADQKDLPAAIDAYHKALAIDPKYAATWNNLGNALRDQKDLPAAIDAFHKALDIDRKDALAWYNLGLALSAQKDLPGAIDAFKKAINVNRSYAQAHAGLGLTLRDQGNFADAVAALQRASQLLPKGHSLRPFVEGQLKQCQLLLALEQRLPNALKGEKLSPAEYLALADLCQRYQKRYRDGVELYAKAFPGEPKLTEDRQKGVRYNAACAAALAAAGKGLGADNLPAKEKFRLRQQAFDWLKADLATRGNLLEKNPFKLQQDLQHWQKDADLTGVRDEKTLAKLPAAEQDAWRQLWADIEALRKQARSNYTETQHKGTLSAKQREQAHPVQMSAGKTYVIDMESQQFDTYLRLEDANGKVLAENDDISPTDQNSRIVFTASTDGAYRIVATSFQQRGAGTYTITVREFAAKKN